MEILHLPDGRSLVLIIREVYKAEERDSPLEYRRRLGLRRIAQVIEAQLGDEFDTALVLAAELLHPRGSC